MIACPKPDRPIRSKAHLKFVAGLPCCITGISYQVVAHHLLRRTDEKCAGQRSGDDKIIPLTTEAHTALHGIGDETGFLEGHGIDGPALAKALWDVSPNHEAGLRVVMERMT